MEKINYKIENDCMGNISCETLCPYNQHNVGSYSCKKCQYFQSLIGNVKNYKTQKLFVICNFSGIDNTKQEIKKAKLALISNCNITLIDAKDNLREAERKFQEAKENLIELKKTVKHLEDILQILSE